MTYFNLNTLFQFEIKSSNILNDQGFTLLINKFIKILFYSSHAFFKHPILILDALLLYFFLLPKIRQVASFYLFLVYLSHLF